MDRFTKPKSFQEFDNQIPHLEGGIPILDQHVESSSEEQSPLHDTPTTDDALSDVIVSSSKKPESFGRAVAEAICMDKPVIATNHGGVKDIIIENENGFFFEVGDEKELANNILKARNLEFDGYNYISSNFSLDNMVNRTIEVYKRLI